MSMQLEFLLNEPHLRDIPKMKIEPLRFEFLCPFSALGVPHDIGVCIKELNALIRLNNEIWFRTVRRKCSK